jgi:hypothetical protein
MVPVWLLALTGSDLGRAVRDWTARPPQFVLRFGHNGVSFLNEILGVQQLLCTGQPVDPPYSNEQVYSAFKALTSIFNHHRHVLSRGKL